MRVGDVEHRKGRGAVADRDLLADKAVTQRLDEAISAQGGPTGKEPSGRSQLFPPMEHASRILFACA